MIGPQHDLAKHPVTGKPMTGEEMNVPDAPGEVTRVVSDKKGRVVIVYRDGHLLVREMDGMDIVWQTLTPQVTIQ
jgi:hypothetical protein